MAKKLMKGNEVIVTAALEAGCQCFFGYPITPQNEIPEYFSQRLPQVGGGYVQAESEVASINMVYGAAGSGVRVMTSSSSPGLSLMQEGISYLAGAKLPCVIVNIMRGGPGLGGIHPAQSDYFQATRGGGNGDYRVIVLAPKDLQELAFFVMEAFDLADLYRMPVMVVGDGMMGQMMEPVEIPKHKGRELPPKEWAAIGTEGKREPNVINSLYLDVDELADHNKQLSEKYREITEKETRYSIESSQPVDLLIVAYGTMARIAENSIVLLKERGISAALFRPITLWPFPEKALKECAGKAKAVLCVEMSEGQMVDDVKIAVEGRAPVSFLGHSGGRIPTPKEVVEKVESLFSERSAS